MRIHQHHVFITGSAKRLGRALAERLLDVYDIRLSAHYHSSEAAMQELVEFAKARGRAIEPVKADLRDVAEIRAAVAQATARFGPVQILINSASDFYPTPLEKVTEEQWDSLLDLNLKGQFFVTQACWEGLLEKGGVVLNLCDVHGEKPLKRYDPYVASKAGLLMLTRNLAVEGAPKVRVNAISPGSVLLPEHYGEAKRKASEERSLLKRIGSPTDVVEAALFLIENDYMTGANLYVDGGRSLT